MTQTQSLLRLESNNPPTFVVRCPLCGIEQIEQGAEGKSEQDMVTVAPDLDEYSSPLGTRGGYTDIALYCADGHNFSIVVANHKGQQVIGLVPAT